MAPILDAVEQEAKDRILEGFSGPGVAITPLLMGCVGSVAALTAA
jgi:hypothetical protein